jgi:predicted Zn-dependent protease
MRSRALSSCIAAVIALAPIGVAAGDMPDLAVGYICSAEQSAPAPGSQRRLARVAGMGVGGFAIQTSQPEAQAWFDYGMQLAHAFYHEDAKAAFRKARELDPACAMCAWGEAWADGPTINFDVSVTQNREAATIADRALALAGHETPLNRALIEALRKRYAARDAASDLAFARALDDLSRLYPKDDEVAILTSDAWIEMVANHQDRQGLARAVTVLQPVLGRHPDNTGAIHFYIHATEWNHEAPLALAYANRLGALAPGASHLVHMASHTFFRVGRYEDAAVANAAAIAVDGAYLRAQHDPTVQGSVPYHAHNLAFGLAGAMASGDAPLAARLADHEAFAFRGRQIKDAGVQWATARAWAAYGRYAPTKALALADPGAAAPFAAVMRHYARGEAFARSGDAVGLRAEIALMSPRADGLKSQGLAVAKVARLTLVGRLAMMTGDPRAAAKAYAAAAGLQDAQLSGDFAQDPPPWWFPERRSLAAALLAQGKPAEAIVEARKALADWPAEPLTLQVLAQAEQAAGQNEAAARDLASARRTWLGDPVSLARI